MFKYEEIKDKLQTRLCNSENREFLKDLVTTDYDIFTAYYTVNYGQNPENYVTSLIVNKELIKYWGITERQLINDAKIADEKRGAVMFSVPQYIEKELYENAELQNILEDDTAYNPDEQFKLYVLTNPDMFHGASLILHPEIRKQIGDVIKSDFYAIPSSIHEHIIVPDDGTLDPVYIINTVREINGNSDVIEQKDVLSNDILWCGRGGSILQKIKARGGN